MRWMHARQRVHTHGHHHCGTSTYAAAGLQGSSPHYTCVSEERRTSIYTADSVQ